MKKIILILALSSLFLNFYGQAPNADAVIGNWLTASGKAIVQIYKSDAKYNGKIFWLKTPNNEEGKPKMDKNNPDKAKQTNPLMGLNMLKGFVFNKNQWEDGTIYDPENGKTYSCKITYRDGKLDLRGFIGISLIGRTQTWTKVELPSKK
jgi:uncharacterized protein (DUF2147 family)